MGKRKKSLQSNWETTLKEFGCQFGQDTLSRTNHNENASNDKCDGEGNEGTGNNSDTTFEV